VATGVRSRREPANACTAISSGEQEPGLLTSCASRSATLAFLCIIPATGFAEEKSYLCAINEVYECVAVSGCSRISVEDANLTGIMLIDVEKKQLRTAPLGEEHRADDIENVAVTDKASSFMVLALNRRTEPGAPSFH